MSYTIAQTAAKTGISIYTLRYYDKEGLLPYVKRDDKDNRVFTEEDLGWLSFILCLKNTGMSLKEIREYIKLCEEGDSTLEHRLRIFHQQKETVNQRIAELEEYQKMIDYKIGFYEKAIQKRVKNS
jgi:DNA-binding transcriptional MerR regulator